MRRVLLVLLIPLPALADPPVVETADLDGSRASVTLSHPDTGWDHYADGWRVEREDGSILGTRILYHPHVDEQPFTRALGGVVIPDGVGTVYIRAKCSVDGWSDARHAITIVP